MKFFQLIFFIVFATKMFSQHAGEKTNITFELYQYDATNGILSCEDANELQNNIYAFNYKIILRAREVADSLTQLEKPCYKYTLEIEPKTLFTYKPSPNEACVYRESVDSLHKYINSKIYVVREKSNYLPLYLENKSVFCDYEIKRTLISD